MSTPDPVAGLARLLNLVGTPPVSPADALRPQLDGLKTGDYVPVHVLNTLPNGRFHVLVKDQLLDLNLPANTEPGDTLELRVERNDGRLQFSMPSQQPLAGQQNEQAVSLSPAARLLQEALQRTQTQEPARLSSPLPLAEGEPQAAPLAENLRQAVRESGLFYESHQQQWVAGQKPLNELLREPQARLLANTLMEATATPIAPDKVAALLRAVEQASPEQLPAALRELAQAVRQGAEAQTQASTSGSQAPKPEGAASQTPPPPEVSAAAQRLQQRLESTGAMQATPSLLGNESLQDAPPAARDGAALGQELARLMARPEVQNMVQQQIQALETHHLLWQGQVWPGQDLDWEIVGQREEGLPSSDDAPTRWTSRLALDLPHLGRVVARLQLSQGQIQLHFNAENADAAQALRSQQQRLQTQFSDAQLVLTSASVALGLDEGGDDV